VFTVAYVVRAVSPGRYVLPQALVEDMYRPERFGATGNRHDRGHGSEIERAMTGDLQNSAPSPLRKQRPIPVPYR